MENTLKKNRYMYLYNWITLLYTWNVINLLLQLKKKKLRFSNFEELVKNEIYCKNKYSLKNIYALCVHAKTLQLCPALCDPMDCSLPNSSVRGILQARILEWIAISFSRGSSWPRDWTMVSCIAGRLFTTWATRETREWIAGHSSKAETCWNMFALQHLQAWVTNMGPAADSCCRMKESAAWLCRWDPGRMTFIITPLLLERWHCDLEMLSSLAVRWSVGQLLLPSRWLRTIS